MNDTDRPHHSNGVCLHCGGLVDDNGMSHGGDFEEAAEGELDPSGGPTGDAAEEDSRENAREFARHLQRTGG